MGFTGMKLTRMYEDMSASLDTMEPSDVSVKFHDFGNDLIVQPNLEDILDKLKETHATSAGLKVGSIFLALEDAS
jgi:acyl-CoA oxidase